MCLAKADIDARSNMLDLLPRRALFSFELPIHYCARPPRVDGDVSKWAQNYLVPPLIEIDRSLVSSDSQSTLASPDTDRSDSSLTVRV